jgi:RecA/RadA recombinase
MKQAGRDSAASKEVVTRLPGRFLAPADGLTVEQQKLWARTVATKPVEWFQPDTIPLLTAYCRMVTEIDRVTGLIDAAYGDIGDDKGLQRYDKLLKARDTLHKELRLNATALRLTPQSNMKAEVSHTANKQASAKITWGPQVIEHGDSTGSD